jgi:hypothetical protein
MRTWVTVGVVVGMVMLCAGLCLPSVCMVREAAARMQCTNHLHQVMMGVNHYEDFHKSFPTATHPNPNLPPEDRLSWLVSIIPFIECNDLYSQIDKDTSWNSESNRSLVAQPLNLFLCPSNPHLAAQHSQAHTHYVGIAGLGVDAVMLPLEDPRAGCFGYDRRVTRKDMKRGASTTVVLMETANQNGPWAAGGFATVRGLDTNSQPYFGEDRQFGVIHAKPVLFGGTLRCNVALADGSIRYFTDNYPRSDTLEVLVTLGPGEVGPDF